MGWWQGSANEGEKAYFKEYLGVDGKDPAWALLKESLKSVSQTAIMLMQASHLRAFTRYLLSFPLFNLCKSRRSMSHSYHIPKTIKLKVCGSSEKP